MTKSEALEFLELPETATDPEIKIRVEEKLAYFERLSEKAPSDFLRRLHARNAAKVSEIQMASRKWPSYVPPVAPEAVASEPVPEVVTPEMVIMPEDVVTSETVAETVAPAKPAAVIKPEMAATLAELGAVLKPEVMTQPEPLLYQEAEIKNESEMPPEIKIEPELAASIEQGAKIEVKPEADIKSGEEGEIGVSRAAEIKFGHEAEIEFKPEAEPEVVRQPGLVLPTEVTSATAIDVKPELKAADVKAEVAADRLSRQAAGPGSAAEPQPVAWLIRHTENQSSKAFPLYPGKNFLGRKPRPDLIPFIEVEEDPYISKVHAVLYVEQSKIHISDPSGEEGKPSKNGIFINADDNRLTEKTRVKENDTIQIGVTKLILRSNNNPITKIVEEVEEQDYMHTVVIDIS